MAFILGLILGGIYFWAMGRATMFNSVQTEIKKRLIDQTYSSPETYGLREHLKRWYSKRKFF